MATTLPALCPTSLAFRHVMNSCVSLSVVVALSVSAPAFADTTIFDHSKVRTEPSGKVPTESMANGALTGIRSRLGGQSDLKSITLSKDKAPAEVLWTKGDKDDKFALAGPNTLQCLSSYLKVRLKKGSEVRIACKFFEPETFIAAILHTDGVLELQTAKLLSTDPKLGPTPKSMKKKYGIFGFASGSAEWTKQEYAIIDEGLSRLSKRELKIIADVPFVRDHASKGKRSSAPGRVAGLYLPGKGKHESKIYIYDAFTQNTGILLGTVDQHYAAGTMAFVHEIGHALASAAFRKKQNADNPAAKKIAKMKADRDVAEKAYRKVEKKYNAKKGDRSVSQDAKNKMIDELNAKIHAFNALDNKVKKVLNAENALIKKQERAGKPAEAALMKLLSKRKAVTAYGRTSPGEAFAEAFMLFKLDPAALKRMSPKAFEYFKKGKYLDEIDADVAKRLAR